MNLEERELLESQMDLVIPMLTKFLKIPKGIIKRNSQNFVINLSDMCYGVGKKCLEDVQKRIENFRAFKTMKTKIINNTIVLSPNIIMKECRTYRLKTFKEFTNTEKH